MIRRASAVLVLATLTLTSGCFFGRSPGAKKTAYACNGIVIGAGVVLTVASVASANNANTGSVEGGAAAAGAGGAAAAGLIAVAAGVAGLVTNALVPTKVSADAGVATNAPASATDFRSSSVTPRIR
jgi:hypothetical protein